MHAAARAAERRARGSASRAIRTTASTRRAADRARVGAARARPPHDRRPTMDARARADRAGRDRRRLGAHHRRDRRRQGAVRRDDPSAVAARGKPFVKLNCAALAESLLESELFGHERGAFTGAITRTPGLFEAGDGGTVFLDEIGELPLPCRPSSCACSRSAWCAASARRPASTLDVRFVCATNRDLADEVDAGRFRRDLYYRLNGVTHRDPAAARAHGRDRGARARVRDAVARHAIAARARRRRDRGAASTIRGRATSASCATRSSARSLLAVGRRGSHLASRARARGRRARELGDGTRHACRITLTRHGSPAAHADPQSLANAVADLERKRILDALEQCGGNQTRAARALGISRNTLLARLDAYGLPRPRKL